MNDDLLHTARQMPRQLREDARRMFGDEFQVSLPYRAAQVIEDLLRAAMKGGAQ